MAVGRQFDMKEYIEKRMMGLEEPEERKLFKEVVGEVLLNLYEYNRKAYESLEKRILDEYSPAQNQYAVYVSITERSRCDITDTFLNPMCREDLEKRQISGRDIRKAMEEKQEFVVDTVFFKGSASETYGLLSQGERIFHGTIRTDKRTYGADFSLRQNRKYLQMVEELYPVFEFNSRTWLTVCTAYLTKMLDICLSGEEAVGEEEEILEIEVDFEEYGGQIQYDMVPLWNLLELTEKTSTYPIPCVDQIHYEHRIFARRLRSDCEYLIRNRDTEVTGIRRQKGDLYIICPEEQPCEWHLYQAAAPDGRERYAYPVLSNQYRESFSGRVTEMFQRSIKTRAELGRLIEAFDYGTYVTYQGIRTESLVPPECIPCNYNMDGFIADEFHTGSHRPVLVIEFSQVDSRNFLTEDIMSFLVTQVQRVFPDYHCVGSLIQGLPV